MTEETLFNALEECLSRLESGEGTLESCLASYPEHAGELRPMLQALSEFDTLPKAVPTPQQVAAMQVKILGRVQLPAPRPVWHSATAVVSVAVIVLLLVAFALNTSPHPSDPTPEKPLAADITVPEPEATATDTPAPAEDTAGPEEDVQDADTDDHEEESHEDGEIPLPIVITGVVESTGENSVTFAGGFTFTGLPDDLDVKPGDTITIGGEVNENGTVEAVTVEPAADEPTTASATAGGCGSARCHPVLLLYAETFGVPYAELEALHQSGYGIGEIGRIYMFADSTGVPADEVIAMRNEGKNWKDLQDEYDGQLAPGRVIGGSSNNSNQSSSASGQNGRDRSDNPNAGGKGNK